jgi:lysophospholipase L1-like esterase
VAASRLVATGLVLAQLAIGLVASEVAIRLYAGLDEAAGRALRSHDPMAVSIAPHGRFGYRQRPNSTFHYGNGTTATSNAMGFRGPLVHVPKPPGVYRIVLLGGSTTHGWGVRDEETIDAHMRRLLQERHGRPRFEVVNLAFDGYDSHQLVERLHEDGLRLEPDLVIVNSGINDVRNARFANLADPDPRTLYWEDVLRRLRADERRGGPTLWSRLKHHAYVARLPGLAREYLNQRTASGQKAGTVPNLAAADIFERNLERMAALAAAGPAPVIFSTPPSSLRSRYAPGDVSERSYWLGTAATTQAMRDELARRMQRVVEREAGRGRDVAYVSHDLPGDLFLDDAHLTPAGNLQVASSLVRAAGRYIEAAVPGSGETLASRSPRVEPNAQKGPGAEQRREVQR